MFNITAFLQNSWFKPGTSEEIINLYRDDQKYHRIILSGTKSGGIIYSCFGPQLWEHIHWDNVAWKSGTHSKDRQPADMDHVRKVLETTRPRIVISFGRHAKNAINQAYPGTQWFEHLTFLHPTSFGMSKQIMAGYVAELRSKMNEICVRENIVSLFHEVPDPLACRQDVPRAGEYLPPQT